MEIVTTLWVFVGIMATNQKWIWRKLSDVLQFSLEMWEYHPDKRMELPGGIRDKWVGAVMNVRRRKEREATLRDFIGFIKETDLVNDPLFSKSVID